MHITHRQDWNISASEAIALQKQMAAKINYDHPIDIAAAQLVAGVDVSAKTPGQRTGEIASGGGRAELSRQGSRRNIAGADADAVELPSLNSGDIAY